MLGKNQEFCAAVQGDIDDRNARLDAMVNESAKTIKYKLLESQSVSQGFTTRLVNTDSCDLTPSATELKAMFQDRSRHKASGVGYKRKLPIVLDSTTKITITTVYQTISLSSGSTSYR